MNEPRPKPVYGMKNDLHTKLEYLRWELDEAKEAVDTAQTRLKLAAEALSELLSEDGPVFIRVRCESCLSEWHDERSHPTVTNCPMCGKKQ